jgi:hypothetical protein
MSIFRPVKMSFHNITNFEFRVLGVVDSSYSPIVNWFALFKRLSLVPATKGEVPGYKI